MQGKTRPRSTCLEVGMCPAIGKDSRRCARLLFTAHVVWTGSELETQETYAALFWLLYPDVHVQSVSKYVSDVRGVKRVLSILRNKSSTYLKAVTLFTCGDFGSRWRSHLPTSPSLRTGATNAPIERPFF